MSLSDAMANGKSRKKISVKDIRMNKLNFYEPYNIDELALLIKRDGQLENLTVYEEQKDDGKRYTLVGGHRRYLAISKLYEQGDSDGLADVVVVRKPETESDEKMMIQSDNAQRIKTKEEIKWEIQIAQEKWEYLSSINQKPILENGQKKRDWIGQQVGLKGRQVQEYLTGIYSHENNRQENENEESDSSTPQRQNTEKDIIKSLKKSIKQLSNAIEIAQELNMIDLQRELELINEELKGKCETI